MPVIPRALGWWLRGATVICAALVSFGWGSILDRSRQMSSWWGLLAGVPLFVGALVLFSRPVDRIRFGWPTCCAIAGAAALPILIQHFVLVSAIWARHGDAFFLPGLLSALFAGIALACAIRASFYYWPTPGEVVAGGLVSVVALALSVSIYAHLFTFISLGE